MPRTEEQQAAARKASNEWYQRKRAWRRDKTYGLEPGQYDRMLQEQDSSCLICRKRFVLREAATGHALGLRVPCVDHDRACCGWAATPQRPTCGQCNRGLVCKGCNIMLGMAGDDVETLLAAALFLERWRSSR